MSPTKVRPKLGDMGLNEVNPSHILKFENTGNDRVDSAHWGSVSVQ